MSVLRDIREGRGMSIKFVAKKINKSSVTISRYEANPMSMKLEQLCMLSELYQIPANDLVIRLKKGGGCSWS